MEFQFILPSVVNFGPGVIKKLGEAIKNVQGQKVFCVYDKGIKEAGIADKVIETIKGEGLSVVEFDDVEPNPKDTTVEKAAKMAKDNDIDVLVGIGGGSPMDCAKAINILLSNPSPINQYNGLNMVQNPTKPLFAVPTTAGTGSEVTSFTIITDTEKKKKMVIGGQYCGAAFAYVDPELTYEMPPKITASTGMDALTHAIEAYLSKGASLPTDINAAKAIDLIYNNLEKATQEGQNKEAREKMLLGSLLAGIAFNSAVLGLAHSIAHPLSAHCNLPHGVANAAVLPYVMQFNAEVSEERMKEIANYMGLSVGNKGTKESSAMAVGAVKDLAKRIEIPTLKDAGVKKEDFATIAKDALEEISTLFNPRDASEEDVLKILEQAY